MTVRRLICVCGSSVALGLTSASAQDTTTNRSTPQQDTTRTLQTGTAEDVQQVLEQRQGVWKVDLMLSEDFFKSMGAGHSKIDSSYITPGQRGLGEDSTTRTTQPGQTGQTQPADKDDPANPWFDQDDKQGTDPTRPAQNQTDPNQTTQTTRIQPGQTDTAMQPGMKQLSGYAECDLVLGENVLHERIVVPAAGQDLGIPDDNQQTQNEAFGSEGFRGITMISFDPESKTYDLVMLSNQYDGIQYDTGIYDAQRNRVVFRGTRSDMTDTTDWMDKPADTDWRDDPTTQPGQDQPDQHRDDHTGLNDPENQDTLRPSASRTQPLTTTQHGMAGHRGLENVVVVLEVMDDNTQRVTMYDTSASSTTDPTQPQEWDRPTDRPADRDLDDDLDDVEDDIDDELDDLDDDLEDDLDDNLDDDADIGDDYDGRKDQDALRDQPTITRTQPSTRTAGGEFGKIIYQATYTRADSTEEASIRSMIDREIVVASR